MQSIILAPIISEKSMSDAAKGRYTFRVSVQSTKQDVKKAVEEKFKVHVVKVATVTIKGRSVRAGVKRIESLKQPFKKAMVTVKAGEKITIFETGTEAK
jgi:large subunit ribosomal protein L23